VDRGVRYVGAMGKPANLRPPRMTADDFLAWAVDEPKRPRFELVAGELVIMAPERSAHALVKARVWLALHRAIEAAGLQCIAYPDGMAVKIDDNTVYEPDALIRCGEPLAEDEIRVTDPVVVVEVLSPSSRARDTGAKLEDYFRLPSVRHYLIVKTENRTVVHHQRLDDDTIRTRIARSGELTLAPPGISIAVAALFP
jgi:Uma2 family endonuclease